jgi:hypothetical protein
MTGKMPATLFKYTRMIWTSTGISECISGTVLYPVILDLCLIMAETVNIEGT